MVPSQKSRDLVPARAALGQLAKLKLTIVSIVLFSIRMLGQSSATVNGTLNVTVGYQINGTPTTVYSAAFSGATLGEHIQNALAAVFASPSIATNAGVVVDARSDTTSLQINSNPFAFVPAANVGSIKVLWPAGEIAVSVPIVLEPGNPNASATTTSAFNASFEGTIDSQGIGTGMGITNVSNTEGTTFYPSGTFPTCIATVAPGNSNCTAQATWKVTTTALSDANFNTQMIVIPSGFEFNSTNGFAVGEVIVINPTGTSSSESHGIITGFVTAGTANCPGVGGTNDCAIITQVLDKTTSTGTAQNFIAFAPMFSLGAWNFSATQVLGVFGIVTHDMTIECGQTASNPVAGCVPVLNWYSAEQFSGVHDAWLFNYVTTPLQVEGSSVQSSYYYNLEATPANCTGAPYNGATIGYLFRNSGAKGIFNSAQQASTNCHPTYGMVLDSSGMVAAYNHTEQYVYEYSIADGVPCPHWCTPVPSSIGGITFLANNGACKSTNLACNASSGGAVLHIGTGETVGPIWATILNSTGNLVDSTVLDQHNGNTLSSTNNKAVLYYLDQAGKCSQTDANPADSVTCTLDSYNSVLQGLNAGTPEWSLNSATGLITAATANAPVYGNTTNTATTVQGGTDATTTGASGTITARGEDVTGGSAASLAGGAATFRGGDNASSGATETAGAITIRGGDTTNASSAVNTAGGVTIRGGNNSSTGTASVPGTVSIAGGSQSGAATNTVGADVTIEGGLGTGNATPSHVKLQVPGFVSGSGSGAQSTVTTYVIHKKAGSTTTATATNMFSVPIAANQTVGVLVIVHVETTQATPHNCSTTEVFTASAENTSGTVKQQTTAGTIGTICDTGNLTISMAGFSTANPAVFSVTPSWTVIAPTAVIITVEVHNLSQQDISLL